MDKSKDSTTGKVIPDDPNIENSDENNNEGKGDDVDKQPESEQPTNTQNLPKGDTAKDDDKADEDTRSDNNNPSSGECSDEKGSSQPANRGSDDSGKNEGMQIKDDVDKQLEPVPLTDEQNLPKSKTAKDNKPDEDTHSNDNNLSSGEGSDDKGGSGDLGENEGMQINDKNENMTKSSLEQEEQPHDQRHTDDQEMASQSSGGDTEPAVSSDNDEEQTTANGLSGTEVKERNSGDNKKSDDDKGSGDDDNWTRPWREQLKDRARHYLRGPRTITLPRLSHYSSLDTVQYRQEYPDKEDDPRINCNYEFYANLIPSYPEGNFVDIIHEDWWGNYRLLEYHHSYIQWLFPIRERGLNWHAQELQLHEKKKIIEDKEAHRRVLKSYKMMLDFYGLELVNEETGEVKRSKNWRDRFENLNSSGHNNLRITRILKCLGEFEYEHLKTPLIKHFLREAITERTLSRTLSSCVQYWIEVVKDDKEREELHTYAQQLVDEYNRKITGEK